MQEKSELKVNVVPRLEILRRALGLNWKELAKQIGISYVMLHYIKTGKKRISVKLDYRIRQVEEQAGLPSVTAQSSDMPSLKGTVPREHEMQTLGRWMQTLKHRWWNQQADRDEIALAVRVLFPADAKDILAWLAKRGPKAHTDAKHYVALNPKRLK